MPVVVEVVCVCRVGTEVKMGAAESCKKIYGYAHAESDVSNHCFVACWGGECIPLKLTLQCFYYWLAIGTLRKICIF